MPFPIRQCCQISQEGLWSSNVALKQLLGLCPLLAVSATVVNSLGLGLATLFTLIVSNLLISVLRHWIPNEIRLPIFVLIIASVVTIVELIMHAYFPELHRILGIFIPLIVTNCAIIGRAESFASKQKVGFALIDGITMGLGFTLVLVLLGGLREIVSQGTLFADAQLLFGSATTQLKITLAKDYGGFLLAALPPGAFIGLGLLVALKNSVDHWIVQRKLKAQSPSNIPQTIQTSVDRVS
ncbi:electron transport complex subunit E [Candidatus Nitrosacidococcus sp. I8]|uniref:electron transport complex subunit E n=1 Tax=Candidatus Nitrosacidococcus sp. I8 TaxID=2942908 RepID=UPI002226EB43|nr:electron transport complex subunit E [Candidatus Nitrosacidococcus sp. I8]CAH9018303.1 Ion-translocating oxidoreductase complex subunit E [Candidatus Nitrosacidococcus sp. I8]